MNFEYNMKILGRNMKIQFASHLDNLPEFR